MCVQKSAHNVRTNLCVQMAKCAYKKGYFCQIFDIFVTFQKFFDGFVRTKMSDFRGFLGVFWSKLAFFDGFVRTLYAFYVIRHFFC